MKGNIKYIFVDLDGTLVRTDLFLESVLVLVKQNFLNIFQIIFWILQGRSVAKARVASLVAIDAEHLPYEAALIDYLKEKKKQNKIIVLATDSDKIYADSVASHLGFFDKVLASDGKNNLKSKNKLAAIRKMVGNEDFIYAGDSYVDRPIWQAASSNIFVNAPHRDIEEAKSKDKVDKIFFSKNRSVSSAFIKEMRLYQWVKNVLVFVPLFTSHAYQEISALVTVSLAFLCFSLCASGVYFLNDMLDLSADRRHERKRLRPLAAGDLPLSIGIAGALGLPLVAFTMAWFLLPIAFFGVLLFYYLATNAYSFFLKRISTADVMTLAILYTLRIIAGSVAINVLLSSWLMAFSVFVFVSLAYLKRYTETSALSIDADKEHGRGYSVEDSETMFSLGISNITASVLVLALYINSDEVTALYKNPEILWFLCLLMLYWGNRIWIGARRGKIHDDPIIFAIKDKVSRIIGIGFILVVIAAKYI